MPFQRYAVYFRPEPGPLARFGAGWLGWDAASGQMVESAPVPALAERQQALTATPRKYGFHATLKPPFRLREGLTEPDLCQALYRLAASRPAVPLEGLRVARIGRFCALVPVGPVADLSELAASCVSDLDGFRAPPTEAELARRRRGGLSAAQEAALLRWGYPHVMEQFRFHMTLTGPLGEGAEDVPNILAAALAPLVPGPITIDALTLMGEDPEGRFHDIERFPLAT